MPEVDPRLREALEDLQAYLADTLAPLLVADAFETLSTYPPALTAEQLRIWALFQFQGRGGATPLADLLYHAIKKIQQLEEHHLVEPERFERFLAGLALALLDSCPPEERDRLATQLRYLRESIGGATALVDHLHRAAATMPAEPRPAASPVAPLGAEEVRDLRRFSLALERAMAALATGSATSESLAQQLLVLATAGARNGEELEARMAKLRDAGLAPKSAPDLFHSLIGALPDWAVAVPEGLRSPASGSLEAVRRAVRLAGDRNASGERWKQLLAAAAEQFNAHAFGRALSLVDLADRMVREGEVDARFADLARGRAHEAYEVAVLLEAAADRQHWPTIRRLLEFHPAWSVRELLDALVFQPDAKKRRLLIALLEVWGADARPAVFDRLETSAAERSRDPNVWWYQRNLVYLLHRLPRLADADVGRELALVAPFSTLAHHPSFQKEAIALLAQLPGYAGVPTLVQRLAEAERALEAAEAPPQPAEEVWKVMNALAAALVRSGSLSARRVLLDHALARRPRDGDTLARLRELGRIDLSGDHDSVVRLLEALHALTPRKVLGFVVGRRDEDLAHVVRALAATSAPEVRQAVAEVTARFAELGRGQSPAGAATAAVGAAPSGGEGEPEGLLVEAKPLAGRSSMSGDLEVFGLAGLLQTFQLAESTGRVSLRDQRGQSFAELVLHRGRVVECRAGRLTGAPAFYQIFETPGRGTFDFARQEPASGPPPAAQEILPLLLEATRRYDELQRLRALVPDDLLLRATGARPTAPAEEREGSLVREAWERVRAGARAIDLEAALAVDSYRVRTLLAHWLEEGALAPGAAPA